MFRFSQPSALNDPNEALPDICFGRYAQEDLESARAAAARSGFDNITDEELEQFYLEPYPAGRFDEKGFPGLWPTVEPRLSDKPLHTMAEFDRAVSEKAVEVCRAAADQRVGIFSLSEVNDDTMWAYYANDHAGVMLTFDTNDPFFAEANALRSILYSDEPIYVSSNDGVIRIAGMKVRAKDILDESLGEIPLVLFLRKRSAWRHEREWRMIKRLQDAQQVQNEDSTIPTCLFSIPLSSIRTLTFGYKVSEETRQEILIEVGRTVGLSHIQLRVRERMRSGRVVERSL